LAALAVEQEKPSDLARLRHGVGRAAIMVPGDQHGWEWQIEIPQVVVDGLKVPDAPARGGLKRHHGVSEQILPQSLAAVEIECRRSQGQKNQPALFIEAEPAPVVGGAGGLPRVAFPGFVAELAGMRDGMEDPAALAGVNVESPHVSRRCRARPLAYRRA